MALWLPDFFKQTPPLPTHFPSSNILLWPSCALGSPGLPHRQQSPSVSPSVSPKTCSAECTLCAQVHTAVYSPPHTIQTLRMHPCTAAAESSTTPTQYCAMTAKQPSPAAPHKLPILAQVLAPAFIHTYHVLQTLPPTLSAPRSCPLCATAGTTNSRFRDRLLYTRAPPCPRKSSCPQHIHPYHHPFAAATPWPVPCP